MSVTSCTVWCITNLLFFLHCQPTEYFLSHSYLIINDVQDPFSSRYSPRGIFCSRTLNFRSISAIGYDMDYTLVQYNVKVIKFLFKSFISDFNIYASPVSYVPPRYMQWNTPYNLFWHCLFFMLCIWMLFPCTFIYICLEAL